MILIYIVGKFFLYCGMFYLLLKLYQLRPDGEWSFSLSWASIRMLVGVIFGLPLLYIQSALQSQGLSEMGSYVTAFGGLRLIEWGMLFALVAHRHKIRWGGRAVAWIAGSTFASMLSDGLAILNGADQLRFFC